MEYRFDYRALHAEEFLRFVNQVWPGAVSYTHLDVYKRQGEPDEGVPGGL